MTDQTVGLPTGRPRLSRLRSVAAQLLRRIELRPPTAWALAGPDRRGPGAAFLGRRRRTSQHSVHRGRHLGADRRSWSCCTRRALFATALIGIAGRADRRHRLGQARGHEHGRARLRHLLLSELLVDGELPVERPAPLPAGARRRAPCRSYAGWLAYRADSTRVSRRWAALAMLLVRRRSPGTAPTPRASAATCSSTTRTSTSPRSTPPGARRSRRCGAERCWRRRRAPPRRAALSASRPRATPRPSRRTSS